jgi:hypothetical protein
MGNLGGQGGLELRIHSQRQQRHIIACRRSAFWELRESGAMLGFHWLGRKTVGQFLGGVKPLRRNIRTIPPQINVIVGQKWRLEQGFHE